MSYLEAHNDILGRFKELWETTTPVDWPNVGFVTPIRTEDAAWVRIRIIDAPPLGDSDSPQITIGSEQNDCRFAGQIVVQVFTDSDIGHAKAITLAQQAGDIFKKWSGSSGVICRIPVLKEVGIDAQGWFQYNCIVGFIRTELI